MCIYSVRPMYTCPVHVQYLHCRVSWTAGEGTECMQWRIKLNLSLFTYTLISWLGSGLCVYLKLSHREMRFRVHLMKKAKKKNSR